MSETAFPRLVRRSPLLPGESLWSLLNRLSALNYYSPGWVEHMTWRLANPDSASNHPTPIGLCPSCAELNVIGALNSVRPDELYPSTSHRFADVLTPPRIARGQLQLPQGVSPAWPDPSYAGLRLYSQRKAQYCSACLREMAYHRIGWMPIAVSVCLKHVCLLANACPECREPVGIRDVVAAHCRRCQADLTQAPVCSVDGDEIGLLAQRTIQGWLNLAVAPDGSSEPLTRDQIPDAPPRVLYHFLQGLVSTAQATKLEGALIHHTHLPPSPLNELSAETSDAYASYCRFATAFKGLINWPSGFHAFLTAYRQARQEKSSPSSAGSRSLRELFLLLYADWLEGEWKRPEFQFVQEAFNQYVIEQPSLHFAMLRSDRLQYDPVLAERFGMLTVTEATKQLGVTPETLKRLIQSGRIASNSISTPRHKLYLIRKDDVLALRADWGRAFGLDETARRLGVSSTIVVEMVSATMLAAERGREVDGHKAWLFSPGHISDYLYQIAARVAVSRTDDKPDRRLTLTGAARKLSVVGYDAVRIIRAVFDRELAAYRSDGEPFHLGRLRFRAHDIEAFAQTVKDKQGWLSAGDIAHRMKVKPIIVPRWIKRGLLTPVARRGSAVYFDAAVVNHFVMEHVFSDEAAKILNLGQLVVQKWVRRGRLKPVSGPGVDECHRYLFRREDVERLRPETRLTASEMAKRLGLGRSQMNAWIRQGKVKPVSGPGIDGSKHYLFQISSAPRDM